MSETSSLEFDPEAAAMAERSVKNTGALNPSSASKK